MWRAHSVAEQKLFLDMMRSCGICFVHREGPDRDDDATEYIAPDLLPERSAVQDELDAMWDAEQPTETAEFDFEMLHPGLARGLICEIGGEAGVAALYWRGGVCAYETTTRSHALIEQQDMRDAWHGHIRVQTQGGQARLLLDRLLRGSNDEAAAAGSVPRVSARARRLPSGHRRWSRVPANPTRVRRRPSTSACRPSRSPSTSSPTPGATILRPKDRNGRRLSTGFAPMPTPRGIHIIRDKTTLRLGERITPFMRRIGAGDRVFVILSEKYLHSPYCMFELLEIWRYSRGDEADFRRRVRIYALPDAKARTPIERIRLARDWKREHDEIRDMIKEDGGEIVGTQDFQRFKLMGAFYSDVPDILATMFDTVQPRSFEELVQYGFADTTPG